MKFAVLAALAVAAGVTAQVDPSTIPPCILGCSNDAAGAAGCAGATDVACICGSGKGAFTASATTCIISKCPDLAAQALSIQSELCSKGLAGGGAQSSAAPPPAESSAAPPPAESSAAPPPAESSAAPPAGSGSAGGGATPSASSAAPPAQSSAAPPAGSGSAGGGTKPPASSAAPPAKPSCDPRGGSGACANQDVPKAPPVTQAKPSAAPPPSAAPSTPGSNVTAEGANAKAGSFGSVNKASVGAAALAVLGAVTFAL